MAACSVCEIDTLVVGLRRPSRSTRNWRNVKTASETAVLKAHGVKPERTRGKLSASNRTKLEIDLNFYDLPEPPHHESHSGQPEKHDKRGSAMARRSSF